MECLNCDYDLDDFANFNNVNERIKCPNCGENFKVQYDEYYDGEEEITCFYLVR